MGKGKSGVSYVNNAAACIVLLSFLACGGSEGRSNKSEPVDPHIRIERLDQDLFRSVSDTTGNFNLKLYAEYGDFYKLYVEQVLQAAPYNDPRLPMALIRFTHDPDWSAVQRTADSLLGDMAEQEVGFNEAFGRLEAAFPDSLVPRIIAFNSTMACCQRTVCSASAWSGSWVAIAP